VEILTLLGDAEDLLGDLRFLELVDYLLSGFNNMPLFGEAELRCSVNAGTLGNPPVL